MSANVALSSRHRDDMATIFDVFCEVGFAENDANALPVLLTKYPEDYNEESVLRSVRQFSFPCRMKNLDSEAVQLFSFVLTDSQSKYTFGYCRYTPRNDICICILSGFPWPTVFYKVLNHISIVMNIGSQSELDALLTRIYHTDIPNIGDQLVFPSSPDIQLQELRIQVPDVKKLPTLREDKFMLEFYNAVSPKQMLVIYASLLKERRIIFTGKKLSQLSSCIYAASTLLRPMFWQSLFIPVLPDQLMDMIMAPMPFLIGIPKETLQKHGMNDIGDVVLVDLDEKTLQSSHDDLATLPNEVQNYLKSSLKGAADMGDSLARSFLRANVLLFGGYRMGFVRNETTGVVTWDREAYITQQRPSCQSFISSLIGSDGVQYLERFLDEKLLALNTGVPIVDEFEREIVNMEGRIKSQVKENATDVMGALKEKVIGIQIGAKLNKLTPKEVRRNKNWSMKKPTKATAGIEPMSFANAQWHGEVAGDSGSSGNASPDPTSSEAVTVPVENLIDFDSPVDPVLNSQIAQFDPSTTSSFMTGQSTFYSAPVNGASSTSSPSNLSIDPFIDPFQPVAAEPPKRVQQTQWEKFE